MEVTVGGARCFIILMRRMTLLTRRRSQHQGVANENCHNLGMREETQGTKHCRPVDTIASQPHTELQITIVNIS